MDRIRQMKYVVKAVTVRAVAVISQRIANVQAVDLLHNQNPAPNFALDKGHLHVGRKLFVTFA